MRRLVLALALLFSLPAYAGFTAPVAHLVFNDPRTITNCVCWLRSDFGITIATGVSAWATQVSGIAGNATQATTAQQPVYATNGINARPKLTFSLTQAMEWALATNGGSAKTVVIVGKIGTYPPTGGDYVIYDIKGGDTLWSEMDMITAGGGFDAVDVLHAQSTSAAQTVGYNPNGGFNTTKLYEFLQTYNGGGGSNVSSYTLWQNHSATAPAGGIGWVSYEVNQTSTFSEVTSNLGAIGGYINSSHTVSLGFIGDIYEAIVYSRVLTAGEIYILHVYMNSLYGQ